MPKPTLSDRERGVLLAVSRGVPLLHDLRRRRWWLVDRFPDGSADHIAVPSYAPRRLVRLGLVVEYGAAADDELVRKLAPTQAGGDLAREIFGRPV